MILKSDIPATNMAHYLLEHVDEPTWWDGEVSLPEGWFGRRGRWICHRNAFGTGSFVERYASTAEAEDAMANAVGGR